MIRILTGLALSIGVLLAWPGQAQAAESYDSCTGFIDSLPATITTQGTWCLKNNLSTAITNGDAITIDANNVTVDCNGFKIGGLAAEPDTEAQGISARARLNATVRNCTIRGFSHGIDFYEGGNHLIEGNTIDRSTNRGIFIINAPGSIVRNNIVANTGRSTSFGPDSDSATGIYADGGADILNNTVNGVVGVVGGDNTIWVEGIFAGNGSVVGNRVRGLAAIGAQFAFIDGIKVQGSTAVFKNIVQAPGTAGGGENRVGIRCQDNLASAHDNVLLGFRAGIGVNCFSSANHTNPN